MARTASQAISWAKGRATYATRMCLQFVRLAFGLAARYPDAATAWREAKYRHAGDKNPPAGVPVFWTGTKNGHVAMSLGGGLVRSTDVPAKGKVGNVSIATLTARWGMTYVGWAEDLNGVRVYTAPKPPAPKPPAAQPTVNLNNLARAAKTDPPQKSSTVCAYAAGTKVVEAALRAEGLLSKSYVDSKGHFGSETVKAYARWQRALGYTGKDANGIPGLTSLKALGKKHGFKVN